MDLLKLPAEFKRTNCHEIGLCVCCREGRKLLRQYNTFTVALKAALPYRSPWRQSLKHGQLFVHLCQTFPRRADGEPDLEHDDVGHRWWHVGRQKLNPWITTFSSMKLMHAEVGRYTIDHPERVLLGCNYQEYTAYEAIKTLERVDASVWVLSVYRIEETERPITTFVPGESVAARRIDGPLHSACGPRLRGGGGDADEDAELDTDPADEGVHDDAGDHPDESDDDHQLERELEAILEKHHVKCTWGGRDTTDCMTHIYNKLDHFQLQNQRTYFG